MGKEVLSNLDELQESTCSSCLHSLVALTGEKLCFENSKSIQIIGYEDVDACYEWKNLEGKSLEDIVRRE